MYAVGPRLCQHGDTAAFCRDIPQYLAFDSHNTSKKYLRSAHKRKCIHANHTNQKQNFKMEVQPNPSAITFSVYSELAFIPKDSSENKWYSPQEKTSFWQSLLADARRMKRAIQESPAEAAAPELVYECLGLEALLDRGVMMEIVRRKSAHVSAVLSEQSRQKSQGSCEWKNCLWCLRRAPTGI